MSRPELSPADRAVRAAVYRLTADTTRVPRAAAVAEALELDLASVRDSLRRLEDAHELGLYPDRDEVWIANPFSAEPTAYPVVTARGTYHGNCAWDALGIPALLGIDGWTKTVCPGTGREVAFGVRDQALSGGEGVVVHMVVPLARVWDDIGFA